MEFHPSYMASQIFDRHHTYDSIPVNPCELLATIILREIHYLW
jgi:hypothetical protein